MSGPLSSQERIAAKVEELDKMIAELQRRKRELLEAKEAPVKVPSALREAATPVATSIAIETPLSQAVVRTPEKRRSKSPLEGLLDSLPWKSFKKKEGEWAFLRDREGRLVDELQSAKDFVERLKKEGEVVEGRYRYHISEDKFINRYYEPVKPA